MRQIYTTDFPIGNIIELKRKRIQSQILHTHHNVTSIVLSFRQEKGNAIDLA